MSSSPDGNQRPAAAGLTSVGARDPGHRPDARPGPLTIEEQALLQRLGWITHLHWTVGPAIVLIALFHWYLGSLAWGMALTVTLALSVFAYNGAAVLTIGHWRRTRFVPMQRLYPLLLNALVVADLMTLAVVIHLGGGADAPALSFYVTPLVVYGAFVARRDTFLHASLAAVLLALVFAGEHIGWLDHFCPPPPGSQCNTGGVELALSRYVNVVCLAFVFAYLTSFVGTNLREQEESSRQMAEERGRFAELRANFVTTASHEFRTPLAVILAASSMLKRYNDRMSPAQRLERLVRIEQQVRHMTELIEDVLDFGQSQDAKTSCLRETVDLDALCREVVAEVQAAAPGTQRVLYTGVGGSCHAVVDPRLVRQMLRNLLINAVKYSPAGEAAHLQLARQDGGVVFRVSDQGIGIPAEDQPHLFEPFHRGTNVGTITGSGLGLVLTKRAVEQHGGTITVRSAAGVGTTILVSLPTSELPETAIRAAAEC